MNLSPDPRASDPESLPQPCPPEKTGKKVGVASAFSGSDRQYLGCPVHQKGLPATRRGGMHTTPAMAAGVADHAWKLEEVVALLDWA